ncbi:carboxypeptidase-like regulatory domain-containing protein [Dysgonomonas sp. 25]|uniref:carboxypeptidase-like regulatory domain-containing protein n=1 Tax=Dysgonomonas sp. 25 TaxID=2302933 RepID=UPI0013D2513B|nr:carboxypeptidase-like regulatory domain-containing protein [Dysgonomonas sp. 25]NDV67390.1 hypothetical protein [Dysgonomonas sp. 25]
MKIKTCHILFRFFSFLSDKTDGAPFFVKYKLLLGTLILGLVTTASCKSSGKGVTYDNPITASGIVDEKTINGTIIDKNEEPVIGASVVIKEKEEYNTMADVSGKFTIQAQKNDTLIFSLIGMKTKEISVSDIISNNTPIIMEEDTAAVSGDFLITCYVVVTKNK